MAGSLLNIFSVLPADCPDKLKKIINDSTNPNETLDNLLKASFTLLIINTLCLSISYTILKLLNISAFRGCCKRISLS